MRKLTIVEFMPSLLMKLYFLIRVLLIGVVCLIIWNFWLELGKISEQRKNGEICEQKIEQYKEIVQKGDSFFDTEDYSSSKTYYLQAIAMGTIEEKIYIRLSWVYQHYKKYKEAIEVLESFPSQLNSQEIEQKKKELKEYIKELENSIFIEEE